MAKVYPVEDALMFLRSGFSLNETAKFLGCTAHHLSRAVKAVDPTAVPAPKKRDIPDSVKRTAVSRFNLGTPAYRVAAELGVSDTAVLRWASSGRYE